MEKQKSLDPSIASRFRGSLLQFRLVDIGVDQYVLLVVQVGLFCLVANLFKIEEAFGFLRIIPIILVGFAIHALLPLRYRMPFFLALSVTALYSVLGSSAALILIALGLVMIGVCHIPVVLWVRVVILVGIAAVLALFRSEIIPTGWSALVFPILGSIFMFRLVVYLYDLKDEKPGTTIWQRLSYFFLLPNVCFPLFPVVDYRMFKRTYYDSDAASIYQRGMLWIVRGTTQLVLYRLVYHNLLVPPAHVEGLWTLVQSMVATYLLYLRISGQFHMVVGLLCLFGMNLAETHHLYYLASSFSDYWRRINIYWKDFMMKIFFYPSFMRLRRFGTTTALVTSTTLVFIMTFILHSYQWYWLQASFPLTATDALFWGILGLLVVINSLRDFKNPPKRVLSKKQWSAVRALRHSVRVVGMFLCISTLWYLWSSESVGDFLSALRTATRDPWSSYLALFVILAGLVFAGTLFQFIASRKWFPSQVSGTGPFHQVALYSTTGLVALISLGTPQVKSLLDDSTANLVRSLQGERFNEEDQAQMERGYYESLLTTQKYTSALWRTQLDKPAGWEGIQDSDVVRRTADIRLYELAPSTQTLLKNASFTTNRHGLRDKEYELEKPDSTFRIALLGTSYVMGSGVADGENFESLVEERLNGAGGETHYEILNFAVGGYGVLQQADVAAKRVFDFEPDALIYVAQPSEIERSYLRLINPIRAGTAIEREALKQIIHDSQVSPHDSRQQLIQKLKPFGEDLVRWAYEEIAATCIRNGATPVMLFLPQTKRAFLPGEIDQLTSMGKEAGFVYDINLEDVYDDINVDRILLAPWDNHPNAMGHRIIASRLYEALLASDFYNGDVQPQGSW